MKIGEIFGTGKAVTLSKGNYYIDGELTNISKLSEYDKTGILQWESSELRELALGLEVPPQSLDNAVFCEECGVKQLGDAKFCEECGTVVEQSVQPQTNQGKNSPKNLIESIAPIAREKKIVVFAAAAIALVAIFGIGGWIMDLVETARIAAEEERIAQLYAQAELILEIGQAEERIRILTKRDYENFQSGSIEIPNQVIDITRDGMVYYFTGLVGEPDDGNVWTYRAIRATGETTEVSFPPSNAVGTSFSGTGTDAGRIIATNARNAFPVRYFQDESQPQFGLNRFEIRETSLFSRYLF